MDREMGSGARDGSNAITFSRGNQHILSLFPFLPLTCSSPSLLFLAICEREVREPLFLF